MSPSKRVATGRSARAEPVVRALGEQPAVDLRCTARPWPRPRASCARRGRAVDRDSRRRPRAQSSRRSPCRPRPIDVTDRVHDRRARRRSRRRPGPRRSPSLRGPRGSRPATCPPSHPRRHRRGPRRTTSPASARRAAAAPSSAPGRAPGDSTRSKIAAVGTIGTGPALDRNPRPRASRCRITPSAVASPNAEPPVSTTASTCSTSFVGVEQRGLTRRRRTAAHLARAGRALGQQHDGHARRPERDAADAHPRDVRDGSDPPRSWPAGRGARPRSAATSAATRSRSLRSGHCCFVSLHVARELDDQTVDGVGLLEHRHVPRALEQLEARARDQLRDPPSSPRAA